MVLCKEAVATQTAVHDECRDWPGVKISRLRCLSGVRSRLHMFFLHKEAAVTQTDVSNVRDVCCDWLSCVSCFATHASCTETGSIQTDVIKECRAVIGLVPRSASCDLMLKNNCCKSVVCVPIQEVFVFHKSACFLCVSLNQGMDPFLLARKPLPCMGARSVIYIYIIYIYI